MCFKKRSKIPVSAVLTAETLTEWGNGLVCLWGFVCHWQSDSARISGVIRGDHCSYPSLAFSFVFVLLLLVSAACFMCDHFINMFVNLSLCCRIRSEQRRCRSGWMPFRRWRRASLFWLSFCKTMTARPAIRAMLNSYRWTERQTLSIGERFRVISVHAVVMQR